MLPALQPPAAQAPMLVAGRSSYDGQRAIVGSANLDNQSWSRSREVSVVVASPATVAAWDARLFGSEGDGAVPVDECR